jgi:hypothetical protein
MKGGVERKVLSNNLVLRVSGFLISPSLTLKNHKPKKEVRKCQVM